MQIIEKLYTDASFYDGAGGMAVVAPSWADECAGEWRERWHIKAVKDERYKSCVIFTGSCKCSDSSDAEKRALAIAFLLANDIILKGRALKVEIISDSLCVLDNITGGLNSGDIMLEAMHNIWLERKIILSKVKAHNGNFENELADKWARRTRRQAAKSLKLKSLKSKSQEENFNMKMPFTNLNFAGSKASNNFNNNSADRVNPFAGSSEVDIRKLTEQVLSDENNIGYVTPDGKVMPRNTALSSGHKTGVELVKQRIWGFEAENFYDDEININYNEIEFEELEEDYTGGSSPISIFYSDEAKRSIIREAMSCPESETGGALIGICERDANNKIIIHVERATSPGPEAVRRSALFSPNLDYYKERVNYYRTYNNWDYLGEWHKHPGGFDELSATDIETAINLMRDEGWGLLLLPIVNLLNGQLTLENHVIISDNLSQLEPERVISHVSGFELEQNSQDDNIIAYIDKSKIDSFRASDLDNEIITGIFNEGASYIFLDIPGINNAAAKLTREAQAKVSGLENILTVIVNNNNISCFKANEGDIVPVRHVLLDAANSIYERNAGLTETSELKDKAVCLIGCGSLGSTLALSLARAGVGKFYLFDPDRLSPVNIARHQADLSYLGRNKAAVLSDLIHRVNPAIYTAVFPLDIINSPEGFNDFNTTAALSDILICTTDTDDSRMLVNEFAVNHKIKAIQAGLHERAASGIVQIYEPDDNFNEGCFACHHDRILSESSKRSENIAYSSAADVRDLTIQPGLAAQINLIAETAALRTIDSLMNRKSLPSLTIIYIDRDNQDAEEDARHLSLSIRHLEMSKVPDCPVCGGNNNLNLNITENLSHDENY